jgi:uncharacterized protein
MGRGFCVRAGLESMGRVDGHGEERAKILAMFDSLDPVCDEVPVLGRARQLIGQDTALSCLATESGAGSGGDPAHDLLHCLRVGDWTLALVDEAIDPRAAVAAALLHDIVNVPKNAPDRAQASARSAARARELLLLHGFSEAMAAEISAAIRDHSFSRGAVPETVLGRALQDADRLDSLGALGILRTVSTGASMGAVYFHADDPWADARDLDDTHFIIDHFFRKLLRLPDLMHTERGRREAKRRAAFLRLFLEELGSEIGLLARSNR